MSSIFGLPTRTPRNSRNPFKRSQAAQDCSQEEVANGKSTTKREVRAYPIVEPHTAPQWNNRQGQARHDSGCFDVTDSRESPAATSPAVLAPGLDRSNVDMALLDASRSLIAGPQPIDNCGSSTIRSVYQRTRPEIDTEYDRDPYFDHHMYDKPRENWPPTCEETDKGRSIARHHAMQADLVPAPLTPRAAASNRFHDAAERNKQLHRRRLMMERLENHVYVNQNEMCSENTQYSSMTCRPPNCTDKYWANGSPYVTPKYDYGDYSDDQDPFS